MKEKVVELLIYIMSEMQDKKRIGDIDVSELKTRGYTPSEISAAFSWIYENIELNQLRQPSGVASAGTSRRVFHDAEKAALSIESQGYLMQLSELGLLDEKGLETVVERAMMAGYEKLSVAELREIVASVLFARGADDQSGGRPFMNSDDTIH
ncbi:MAG TPA: DUF494 family protein [Bacteroidota bacterium]|nr:DUF494 family protein [Bacteroidota bacterium]